jgi:Pvc16 N-terminal domain
MSNDQAIAAVTSTLKTMIFQAVSADAALAGSEVTARPPDRARQGVAGNQINLFLYRTSIDAAWRNEDPPPTRSGESGQPVLPLVLSYIVTAYGDNDDEVLSHRLLGLAMSVLHDRPLLSRAVIAASLAGSGLESQIERVRITPHPIPLDEISRMWATFGTGYRTSVSYDAAVVLIDSKRAVVAPTPVLARGTGDLGPVAVASLGPMLQMAAAPASQPAAKPGDTVTLLGRGLGAVTGVRVSGPALTAPVELPSTPAGASEISIAIPSPPTLPAGMASIEALMDDGSGNQIVSNAVPLMLAPTIVSKAALKAKLAKGAASLQVSCAPAVEGSQTVALVVGDRLIAGETSAAGTPARSKLQFALSGFTAGTYMLRLRVDGADSIPVVAAAPPVSPDEPAPLSIDTSQTVVLT